MLLEGRPARALRLERLADVGLDQDRGAAALPDLGGGGLEAPAVAADQDEVRPGLGDGQRHLPPQAHGCRR